MKVGCASAFTPTRGNRASAYGPDTRIDCRAPQYEGHCAVYDSIRSSSCSSSRGASCASSASVASSTRRCCTGSPGRPRVEPRDSRPRRHHQPCHAAIPTRQRCRHTVLLQRPRHQSHGLAAERSTGYEQGCLGSLGHHDSTDRRDELIEYTTDVGLVAHKADDVRRQVTDLLLYD